MPLFLHSWVQLSSVHFLSLQGFFKSGYFLLLLVFFSPKRQYLQPHIRNRNQSRPFSKPEFVAARQLVFLAFSPEAQKDYDEVRGYLLFKEKVQKHRFWCIPLNTPQWPLKRGQMQSYIMTNCSLFENTQKRVAALYRGNLSFHCAYLQRLFVD